MKYFVFDMDEAIAELYSVFYCITSLRLKDTILEDYPRLLPLLSDSLEKQVDKAYHLFVKKVLREELSSKPLGILRPGVLQVMNSLYRLQRAKKVAKVVTLCCVKKQGQFDQRQSQQQANVVGKWMNWCRDTNKLFRLKLPQKMLKCCR